MRAAQKRVADNRGAEDEARAVRAQEAVELAARGYQVVGFDLSLAMLARASAFRTPESLSCGLSLASAAGGVTVDLAVVPPSTVPTEWPRNGGKPLALPR
jgi:hypothetical protein